MVFTILALPEIKFIIGRVFLEANLVAKKF